MHLIHMLVFLAAKFNFWFVASHIPGVKNVAANALPRNALSSFFSQVPQENSHPTNIPPTLVTLVSRDITWTCESWIKQFRDTLQQVAPSSNRTYQSAERHYLAFCNSFALVPLPTLEEVLCYFTACLDQQGLAHSKIRTYLSGVRQLQIAMGERIQVLTGCLTFNKFFEE